ncbi:MAG: VOC family protein [Pseudomonadota bacterium]
MHKSRIGEITIDCQTQDLKSAVVFWSAALGYHAVAFEDHYRFDVLGDDIAINLQSVSHPSRVHIDLETDNIDREVERLERLGARLVRRARRWTVMTTPTGHGICVCQPSRAEFQQRANHWP